jgi:zona occludens toxin (predicted ATPase)
MWFKKKPIFIAIFERDTYVESMPDGRMIFYVNVRGLNKDEATARIQEARSQVMKAL